MGGLLEFVGEIAGGRDGEDAFVALSEEGPFQEAAALVVEKIFVPVVFDEGGDDDDDTALRILCGKIEYVLNKRDDDEAVRRREDRECGRSLAGGVKWGFDVALPVVMEEFGVLARLDVNGDDFGGDAGSEFDALLGGEVPAVDRNDSDGRSSVVGGFDWRGA